MRPCTALRHQHLNTVSRLVRLTLTVMRHGVYRFLQVHSTSSGTFPRPFALEQFPFHNQRRPRHVTASAWDPLERLLNWLRAQADSLLTPTHPHNTTAPTDVRRPAHPSFLTDAHIPASGYALAFTAVMCLSGLVWLGLLSFAKACSWA